MARALLPIAVLLAAMALTGCAGFPEAATRDAMSLSQSLLPRPRAAAIADYALVGRISVRHGETTYLANIDWQHASEHDEILLSTLFGQGIAELTRNNEGARLITADQGQVVAPDWQTLAQQTFGADLPLARLPRWVIADVPDGAQRDGAGRPSRFSQEGWSVAYDRYESAAPDALPRSIEIKGADIEVRLLIDVWQQVR